MTSKTLLALPVLALASTAALANGEFAILDANADGRLTRDEAGWQPLATARFDRLDADRDGTLDRAEFSKLEALPAKPAGANAPAPATPAVQ